FCSVTSFHSSIFFFSSRRRHTRFSRDWSSDVCSSDLDTKFPKEASGVCGDDLFQQHASWHMRQSDNWLRPTLFLDGHAKVLSDRSEERRVGKECRSRWSAHHEKKNKERRKSAQSNRGT